MSTLVPVSDPLGEYPLPLEYVAAAAIIITASRWSLCFAAQRLAAWCGPRASTVAIVFSVTPLTAYSKRASVKFSRQVAKFACDGTGAAVWSMSARSLDSRSRDAVQKWAATALVEVMASAVRNKPAASAPSLDEFRWALRGVTDSPTRGALARAFDLPSSHSDAATVFPVDFVRQLELGSTTVLIFPIQRPCCRADHAMRARCVDLLEQRIAIFSDSE